LSAFCNEVLRRSPTTRILVLSGYSEEGIALEAALGGAKGYVVKGASVDSLLNAITTVEMGGTWVDPSLPPMVFRAFLGQTGKKLEKIAKQVKIGAVKKKLRELGEAIKEEERAKNNEKIEEYENSFQLPFYVYSAVKSGILPLHAIELYNTGRYRTKYIFIFYSNQPCRIVQQEFEAYKSDFFEGRFKTTLEHHVKSAVNIWSESQSNITSPYSGMNTYKGCVYCPYRPGCVTKNTEQEELFLSRFPRISYDPLTFR